MYAQSGLEAQMMRVAMGSAHQSSVSQALLAGAVGQKLGQCMGQLQVWSVGSMHKDAFETCYTRLWFHRPFAPSALRWSPLLR